MASQTAGSQASPLAPTFHGFISCTMDALILFEGCLCGRLAHVSRRPHDRERSQLIQSGNVFIYEEHSSGIKRWTDGVPWSPSRILGNFLLYRELDKPFQPGEKKRAMKRSKTDGVSKSTPSPRGNSISNYAAGVLNSTPTTLTGVENTTSGKEVERAYVGSLVDSYQFKEDGLVKKTISVLYRGVHHHLVSYYSIKDIKAHALKTVHESPELNGICPRQSLIAAGNFRSPVDDNEFGVMDPKMFANMDQYGLANAAPARSMSIPTQSLYGNQWGNNYGHSQGYNIPQTLQPSATYGQPMAPSFTYETAYGSSRQSPFSSGPMVQASRRHSLVPSTSTYGYPMGTSTLVPQGSSLAAHGLSNMSYVTGEIFGASAASAAADAAAGPAADYGTAGTMGHSNGAHSMGNTIPHSAPGFDGQLTNSYEHSLGRLNIHDFSDPLQDPEEANYGPASTTTTPNNMPLGLDHPELSPADQQWNRTPSAAKHDW